MNARFLPFGLLALAAWAPCAAQTPKPPTITVFVRHEGKPVAGAEGLFFAASGPDRLDPSAQLRGATLSAVHSHWILQPPRTLRATSDDRGVLRFQGAERGVLLVRHEGLGAIEHRLSPRTPTRLELEPMGSVAVPGSGTAKVALRHANLAVELPLLSAGKIELPNGRYTGFVLDGNALWDVDFAVAPGTSTEVAAPALLPATEVPGAATSWHPAARPDLSSESRTMRLSEETASGLFICAVAHASAAESVLAAQFWAREFEAPWLGDEPKVVDQAADCPVRRILVRNSDGTATNGRAFLGAGPIEGGNQGQAQRFWTSAPIRDGVLNIPCPDGFGGFLAVSSEEVHGFTRSWLFEKIPSELDLPQGRTVEVTVMEADGKPSVGTWVVLGQELAESEEIFRGSPILTARTDLRGTAVFRNAPGNAVHLRVSSARELPYYQRLKNDGEQGPRRIMVQLETGGIVRGQVRWADGKVRAKDVAMRVHARITRGKPAPERYADVAPNGEYVLRGLAEDRDYVLELRVQIGTETFLARKSRVRSGDAGVQLTLRSEDPPLPGQGGKGK